MITFLEIKNNFQELKNKILIFYQEVIQFTTFCVEVHTWFTVLLPIFLRKWWNQQESLNTFLFIFGTFCFKIYTHVFYCILLLIDCVYFLSVYMLSNYTNVLQYNYWVLRIFFLLQFRVYFYVYFYLVLILSNFYLVWALLDIWPQFFIKYGTAGYSLHILEYFSVLYADISPDHFFLDRQFLKYGRRLFKLQVQGVYRPAILNTLPSSYYVPGFFYSIFVYFTIFFCFLTLIHILKMLKHVFDDYLRDLDTFLTALYYGIFFFLCVYFFFFNIDYFIVYIINFLNYKYLGFLLCIYLFFFFLYIFTLVYNFILKKKKINILQQYFIACFFFLCVICLGYNTVCWVVSDFLWKAFIYVRFLLIYGFVPPYILYTENTPTISPLYLTYEQAQERVLYEISLGVRRRAVR